MICPSIIEKSSLHHPYINKRYDPAILSTQKIDGDTISFAFSDNIHCTRILAEKNICAKKPIIYTIVIRSGLVRYCFL